MTSTGLGSVSYKGSSVVAVNIAEQGSKVGGNDALGVKLVPRGLSTGCNLESTSRSLSQEHGPTF